jgi:hypothetical protein
MNQEPAAPAQSSSILNQGVQNVTNAFSDVKNSVTGALNSFSNQPNATSEFNFSNTIVAKFAFLLLVIIVFMFAINLGIVLISYYLSPQSNPFLVKGMSQGTNPLVIAQNPGSSGSVTLLRSNNQSHGAEFTWSIWLYIDDLPTDGTKYRNIFNKGDISYDGTTGLSKVNNAPGLYLGNGGDNNMPLNTLHVIMDVVGDTSSIVPTAASGSPTTTSVPNSILPGAAAVAPTPSSSSSSSTSATQNASYMVNQPSTVDIVNVPLKKWFHVAIRLENSVLDVYINGTIDKRVVMTNVPKQNYNDVNICQNGGFTGSISDLRYFNSALNVFQLNTIVGKGPNLSTSSQTLQNQTMSNYNYLSSMWYSSQ